jgi:hypothetical protein
MVVQDLLGHAKVSGAAVSPPTTDVETRLGREPFDVALVSGDALYPSHS